MMKFYISFKDSQQNVFRTIRIWTAMEDIELILKQFANNSFNKAFIESVKFEKEDEHFVLSIFGPNKMDLGSLEATVAA